VSDWREVKALSNIQKIIIYETFPFVELIKHPNLTPWSGVLLEKLIVTELFKKFPAFHGTRSSILIFTRTRH
jgi:hypothetical protein